MKKRMLVLFAVFLCIACVFAFVSCDETPDNGGNNPDTELPSAGGDKPSDGKIPHTHAWGDWSVTTPSTCGKKGEEKRSCACGESEVKTLDLTDMHVYNYKDICTVCGCSVGTDGLTYALNGDETTYSVTGGRDIEGDIIIPGYYKDLPVTFIEKKAFNNLDNITGVTFSKNSQLRSIGGNAFSYCDSLTSITIPASVTEIGREAFRDCDSLTTVIFSDNSQLMSIDEYAFCDCNSLTTVNFGDNRQLTSIDSYAFSYCDSLTAVYITDLAAWCSIEFGMNNANPLYYARNLYINENLVTHLEIPIGVTGIKEYAFNNCDSFTRVTIPASVTSIGLATFQDCRSLTSITIPASVTSIGSWAFSGCSKLIEVYNLSSLNITADSSDHGSVAYYAKNVYTATTGKSKFFTDENNYIFYDDGINRYLIGYSGTDTALTLPASCKGNNYGIYQYAFYERDDITGVTIPKGVTSIGNYAFIHCNSLTTVAFGDNSQLTSIGTSAFEDCDGLTSITIPASVTSIGGKAFDRCKLISITIPASVTSIGNNAFDQSFLASITVEDGNTVYHSAENCLIETANKKLIVGCKNSVIPTDGSVTSIGRYAFSACNLTSITIPSSVTSIGEFAFFCCDSLTSITLLAGVRAIDDYAFCACMNLTSITIPVSVRYIGYMAFDNGCYGMTIYYDGSENDWENIMIDTGNLELDVATRYYYSATQPTAAGNWWYYDNDGKPAVWPAVKG